MPDEDLKDGQSPGDGGGDLGQNDNDLDYLSEVQLGMEEDFEDDGTEDKKAGAGDRKPEPGKGKGEAEEDEEKLTLKQERDELLRKNKDLNRALHSEREGRKKGGKEADAEENLSDAQILGILEEYGDDKKTMLNVIKHVAGQVAKGAGKAAVNDAETKRVQKETEEYLSKMVPDALDPETEFGGRVLAHADRFGLSGHPHERFLGTAIDALTTLPELLKQAKDAGKKEALAEQTEKGRQKKIEDVNGPPSRKPSGDNGGDKATSKGLSAKEKEVAGKLGLNSPRQQALLKRLTGNRSTVSVEG